MVLILHVLCNNTHCSLTCLQLKCCFLSRSRNKCVEHKDRNECWAGRVCALTNEIYGIDPLKMGETDRQTPDRCFTRTAIYWHPRRTQ